MAELRKISVAEHATKRWIKPIDFSFARGDHVALMGLNELAKASLSLPLGFIRHEGAILPVVVQGLLPNQNLLMGADGRWLADYIPLTYRLKPFYLARQGTDQAILCADHSLGLIHDGPAGYEFFAADKTLSPELGNVAKQLGELENQRMLAQRIGAVLEELGLLEPWVLQVQYDNTTRQVEGLYRVNEQRLVKLPLESLGKLRDCGGLMVCYAQLFSMNHMPHLGAIAQRVHWAKRQDDKLDKVTQLNLVDDQGTLSFSSL